MDKVLLLVLLIVLIGMDVLALTLAGGGWSLVRFSIVI